MCVVFSSLNVSQKVLSINNNKFYLSLVKKFHKPRRKINEVIFYFRKFCLGCEITVNRCYLPRYTLISWKLFISILSF